MAEEKMENGQQLYYLEPSTGQYRIYDQRERYDIDTPVFVKKANMLIKRVGTTSLMSEKILLAAIATANLRKKSDYAGTEEGLYLTDLYERTDNDFSDGLVSEFRTTELKNMLKIKTSNYYNLVDEYMNNMVFQDNWTIYTTDKDVISSQQCIIGTTYDRRTGRIFIKWNPDLAEKILCSKGNGTMLSLDLMAGFKDLQSFNMYQLLKEEISYAEYLQTKVRKKDPLLEYSAEFNLAQLKFLISINQVSIKDPGEKETRDLIRKGLWEEAEQNLKKASTTDSGGRMYANWYNFRRRTLSTASMAINGFKESCYDKEDPDYEKACLEYHPTDIHYRMELVKKGHTVNGIRFFVRWDKLFDYRSNGSITMPTEEDKKTEEERHQERFRTALSKMAGMEFSKTDVDTLVSTADGDTERVEAACLYFSEYTKEVDNAMGFLVDAIKKGYSAPEPKIKREEEELYSFEDVCERFNVGGKLLSEQDMPQEAVDIITNIIYDILNTTDQTIMVSKSKKPAVVVKDRMLALTSEEIGFVYRQIKRKKQGQGINKNYIITLLYNAHEDYLISKLVPEGSDKPKNKAKDFPQRKYTDEEFSDMEKRKLGVK